MQEQKCKFRITALIVFMLSAVFSQAWAETNPNLKVSVRDEAYYENNIIKPRIFVENIGTTTVSSFDVYYYFKADNGKTPVIEIYYSPDSTVSLIDQGNGYYCVQYRFTDINLAPGAVLPDNNGNVVGIHYPDWSAMNKTNDYSNPDSSTWIVSDKIPAISDGSGPEVIYYETRRVSKLTLVSLECFDTEDTTGDDECYLEIMPDALPKSTVSRDMGEGDIWNIGKSDILFETVVKLRLMDSDTGFLGDDDDNLGEFDVPPVAGSYTGKFTQDGADYTLTYQVDSVITIVVTTVKKYSIVKLECHDTEDTTGDDECYLKIYGESGMYEDNIGQHGMGEGDVWDINSPDYYFVNSASVVLIDADSPDGDDYLGTVAIDPADGIHTGKYTGDGADYTITYKVETTSIVPKTDPKNVKLVVHVKDAGYHEQNIIKPVIYVENTGTQAALNFNCYYYFATEGGKTPVLEDYYTPDSEVSLVNLGNGQYAIRFFFALTLDPGATTNQGGEQVGVHYGDWSVMDRSNDESNPGGSGWVVSDSIPAVVDYPLPTTYSYKGAEPSDSELGDVESELINGIAHSDTYWFWSNETGVQRVPRSSGFTNWDKSVGIPAELAHIWIFQLGYDHFGDCDFYDGKLYVPMTSHDGYPPIVLVYDENLNLIQWGTFGKGGGSWVAINPVDGKLYTSDSFNALKIYEPETLTPYSGIIADVYDNNLGYLGQMETNFVHAPAKEDSWWGDAWVQGGAFSTYGVFYYVVDHKSDENSDYTGVHAFKLTPLPASARALTGTEDKTWNPPATEITLSGGFMNIKFDPWIGWPANSRNYELEGIDVVSEFDYDHILVQCLSNELDDDDVWLYHFQVK